jgi:hypothetical protein
VEEIRRNDRLAKETLEAKRGKKPNSKSGGSLFEDGFGRGGADGENIQRWESAPQKNKEDETHHDILARILFV